MTLSFKMAFWGTPWVREMTESELYRKKSPLIKLCRLISYNIFFFRLPTAIENLPLDFLLITRRWILSFPSGVWPGRDSTGTEHRHAAQHPTLSAAAERHESHRTMGTSLHGIKGNAVLDLVSFSLRWFINIGEMLIHVGKWYRLSKVNLLEIHV